MERGARTIWTAAGLGLSVLLGAALAMVGDAEGEAGAQGSPTGDGRPDVRRRPGHVVPEDSLYKSPVQLLLSPDGERLYVSCEGSGEVLAMDPRAGRVVGRVAVGVEPFGMALSPKGQRLYVGNRWDNDVAVVDVASMAVQKRFPVGDDPHGLALTPDGKYLFVANLGTHDLSVMDPVTGLEVKRLSTGMAPFGVTLSPDHSSLYVSSQYSNPTPFRTPPVLELTVVDVAGHFVRERRRFPSTIIGQGVAVTPDGHFAITALELPKNLIPETQVYQGWMLTYGFALTETRPGGRTAFLLIDEPNLYFADPFGVALAPDGRYLYISSSGADVVTVVDLLRVYALLEVADGQIGVSEGRLRQFARHLALSNEYVVGRIPTGPTGSNPKGLAISADGRQLYVANRLGDDIAVIDTRARRVTRTIDLGGPRAVTLVRAGAKLFNYASISFQKQMSCTTCHPENSVDGLIYDIAVDGGMGHNLVDNLTLRGLAQTAPFKWTGKNPTLERQEGPRAAQLFFRTHGFEPEENQAIVSFIESIPPRPNRYRREQHGELSEFQEWGRRMYNRAYDNQGRYIPVANRCITCHPPPLGTDRKVHDVATKGYHDWDGGFDTPHLLNVFDRVPYMHDGRCYSLEEIWTRFNPDDTHGVTNDMMKEQLNVLIEYIKTF